MAFSINRRCDGCSACVRQCPTQAIFGEFKKSYSIDSNRCIDCGVCGQICPIEAVVNERGEIAARVERNDRLRPTVDFDMCNGCAMCVDICPFHCIEIVGGPLMGISVLANPLACVSCDECMHVCLKHAIKMKPTDLHQLDAGEARRKVMRQLRSACDD